MAVDFVRFFVTGAAAERSAVAGDLNGSSGSLGRRSPGIVRDAIQHVERTVIEMRGFRRNIIAGLVTIIPLLVTWVVVDFVLGVLSRAGGPLAQWLADTFGAREGALAAWLQQPWLQWLLAVLLTVAALYLLGLAASRVIGRRVISAGERALERLPFIQTVYRATKRLVDVLRTKPEERPVVLIEFPHRDMKTLGLVTRIISDSVSGEKLAVVYVPTTPNPTSGYLEIVPLKHVIYTDLTFEEGMSFVVTGGSIGPDAIRYTREPE